MSMTTAYLKAKCTPVQPQAGKSYRVIGMHVSGAIYQVEKVEDGICYFKGYSPKDVSRLQFYEL
jgi:hypothetical protein